MGRKVAQCGTLTTPPNTIKQNFRKVDLKTNFKYDGIYDVLKLISSENLKRPRNFGDIGLITNSIYSIGIQELMMKKKIV